jgi:diguanylate cyclase (GGDEF)-like protein
MSELLTSNSKTPRRFVTDALLLLAITFAAIGIGLFVQHTIKQVKEGLPAQVIKQQREIAHIVNDFTDFAYQIELHHTGLGGIETTALLTRLKSIEQRLNVIRSTDNFDNPVGASEIHAVAKPAVDDIRRWLTVGFSGLSADSPQVARLVRLRSDGASRRIRDLFDDSNVRALSLIETQGKRLERFRESLVLYLSAFGLLAASVIVLFVRQRNAESRVATERKRLVDSIESISEGFALYDADDRLILYNERFKKVNPDAALRIRIGATFSEFTGPLQKRYDDKLASEDVLSFEERLERHRNPRGSFEFRTIGDQTVRVSERKTRDGGTVAIYTDITDLKEANERLEHLASHDTLTGLPNRSYLEERLGRALGRANRQHAKLAVLIFDLDHFKRVNDTLGHAGGDELLRKVAGALEGCMRADETVARLGGDEFAAVLENVSSWSEVSATAERVLDVLCRAFDIAGSDVSVTTSIGIALFPDDGGNTASLLKNADAACYHAKSLGRNNFQFFAEEMNVQASTRLTLERHLRNALERDEFSISYQPILDVASGKISGMEALLRWQCMELGEVPPDDFIPVAEETGLIIPIGEWILEQACRQNKAWRDQGLPPVKVSVNVSARQLRLKGLTEVVKQVVGRSGLDPAGLVLEITESTIMDNVERALQTLGDVHALGVGISIDDFGVGYSSLGALKRFTVDCLKIDRAFVGDITTDNDDFEIVSAVTAMAHKLNMRVVAEGVASQAQADLVREIGCDEVQGFWFHRPMSADDARTLLSGAAPSQTVVPLPLREGR